MPQLPIRPMAESNGHENVSAPQPAPDLGCTGGPDHHRALHRNRLCPAQAWAQPHIIQGTDMICYHCKSETKLEGKPGRQQLCASCQCYLHCCRNCRFYDVLVYHSCREPMAEWNQDKEMGNFCEFFQPAAYAAGEKSKADEARRRLDELFGKK